MMEYKCCNCGMKLRKEQTIVSEEKTFCPHCVSGFNTCQMCQVLEICPFETDRSCSLPKMVLKVIEKNGIRAETQILNPERVQKFCIDMNCPCYDRELQTCIKRTDILTCKNYSEKTF